MPSTNEHRMPLTRVGVDTVGGCHCVSILLFASGLANIKDLPPDSHPCRTSIVMMLGDQPEVNMTKLFERTGRLW